MSELGACYGEIQKTVVHLRMSIRASLWTINHLLATVAACVISQNESTSSWWGLYLLQSLGEDCLGDLVLEVNFSMKHLENP